MTLTLSELRRLAALDRVFTHEPAYGHAEEITPLAPPVPAPVRRRRVRRWWTAWVDWLSGP